METVALHLVETFRKSPPPQQNTFNSLLWWSQVSTAGCILEEQNVVYITVLSKQRALDN